MSFNELDQSIGSRLQDQVPKREHVLRMAVAIPLMIYIPIGFVILIGIVSVVWRLEWLLVLTHPVVWVLMAIGLWLYIPRDLNVCCKSNVVYQRIRYFIYAMHLLALVFMFIVLVLLLSVDRSFESRSMTQIIGRVYGAMLVVFALELFALVYHGFMIAEWIESYVLLKSIAVALCVIPLTLMAFGIFLLFGLNSDVYRAWVFFPSCCFNAIALPYFLMANLVYIYQLLRLWRELEDVIEKQSIEQIVLYGEDKTAHRGPDGPIDQ